jgi:hypothetical protein
MLNVTHAFTNFEENEAKETVSCSFSFYLEKCERLFLHLLFFCQRLMTFFLPGGREKRSRNDKDGSLAVSCSAITRGTVEIEKASFDVFLC